MSADDAVSASGQFVTYERVGSVGHITLDRPDVGNAYDRTMLDEISRCWLAAEADDDAAVVIVRTTGKNFCTGHDTREVVTEASPPDPGPEAYWRWRNIPKPTIAAVQGRCVSGGLLLAWMCDLIIAADDARFSDVVVRYGQGGILYPGHALEFGARRAKELLFTASEVDARECLRLGAINEVVPRSDLWDAADSLASRIAEMDRDALAAAKVAVNTVLDAQGQTVAFERFVHLFETFEEASPQAPLTS